MGEHVACLVLVVVVVVALATLMLADLVKLQKVITVMVCSLARQFGGRDLLFI